MSKVPLRMQQPTRQTGASLTEVLVTLVILSIGLLGLANIQLTTAQGTNSSAQRFEATILAQDILERMRANRQQALAGAYVIDIGESAGSGGIAEDDLQEWKAALAALPDGDGSIEMDGTDRVTITVQWSDALARVPDGQATASVQLRSEL